MGYNLINWENSPSKQTPINAENLNQMDVNIAKAIQGTRFNFSATFTADSVLKNTTSTEALGTGSFVTSQTDIVTVFVADNVTKINNGTFGGCTSLKTIYIDNTVGNVEIVSGAVPDGVSIVYSNDDNFINVNELLASAIKSLKSSVNTNRTDWESRATSIETQHKTDVQALTDKANSIVEQANTDRQNFNNSVDEINTTLDTKENVSNKVSEITHPSLDYYPDTKAVFDYVNSKLETPLADIETLKSSKLDKTDFNSYKTSNDNAVNSKVDTTDFNTYKISTDKAIVDNTFDLSMLMSSLKRTATGTNIVNITNTAENGILKVTSNGCVTCKNKNIFEDITANGIKKTNCNVSYDNGTYTVEYTGDENDTFFFGVNIGAGIPYAPYLGEKLKYNKNLSFRINCDKLTRKGCYITYYNADSVSLGAINHSTNQAFKIDDVEGAEYFTMRIGFDWNDGAFTTGEIVNFSVQIEYGDTVSDFVVPRSNTDNTAYEGVTNVIGEGDITVEYVPDVMSYIDKKCNEIATALVAHESEVI